MKAPQRREREIARTREDIVEAAGRAFVEVGMHDATMQDIAREAGYTAASLYTYFRSKQEIAEAVMGLLTAEFLQVFEQPLPSKLTFYQRFEIVLVRHLELIEKRRALFLSFHTAEAASGRCPDGSHGQAFHDNFERRIFGLADWLKNNAKPEEIGGHDPELVARLLVGMVFGLLHGWVSKAQGSLTDRAPLLRDFFFHGVSGNSKAGGKKRWASPS
jgi:AcrR family transcriptional regulator